MRAQLAITRNSITRGCSDRLLPNGGVLARRTNGDFLISLNRHVSEAALVQMMCSLRALGLGFEMSLEMAGNVACHAGTPACCLTCARSAFSSG